MDEQPIVVLKNPEETFAGKIKKYWKQILTILIFTGIVIFAEYQINQVKTQNQQVTDYLNYGIQLGIFPSGQQLQTFAAQKNAATITQK